MFNLPSLEEGLCLCCCELRPSVGGQDVGHSFVSEEEAMTRVEAFRARAC